jgi:hypothetical protein
MDKFTVRDSNGSVDVVASVSAYSKAINDWVSVNETPVEKIERAVEAVFDSHTSRLPTPFLVSLAVQELGVEPDQFQGASNRVAAYLKGQVASGRLDSTKGKGGGLSRLARPGEPIPVQG